MSKEKIEELAEDIFLYCRAGLLEDDAKKIAEFVIDERGYRKQSENVIELPCKIGDTVYIIDEADDEYGEDYALAVKVLQFFINKHGIAVDLALPLGMRQNTWMVVGKNVFLTREEAEAHMRKEDEGK